MSTDEHDERNLYRRGDPQSDERAREHASTERDQFGRRGANRRPVVIKADQR